MPVFEESPAASGSLETRPGFKCIDVSLYTICNKTQSELSCAKIFEMHTRFSLQRGGKEGKTMREEERS